MIIDCIGCLHGERPKLEGGDLLLVTGDLTARDTLDEHLEFVRWAAAQMYSKIVFIAGNHDNLLLKKPAKNKKVEYLCDSGTEFVYYPPIECMEEGKTHKRLKLKLWGSPWTSRFVGINPKCCAFTGKNDGKIASKFALIPDDVDILITHGPPFTIRDKVVDGYQVGSISLMAEHISRLRPRLWAFSHVHEGYGQEGPYQWSGTRYVNCSIMNERYQPVNAPIRIILSDEDFPSRC